MRDFIIMKEKILLLTFVSIISISFSQTIVENYYGISQNYSLKGIAICSMTDGNFLVLCQGDLLETNWASTIEPVFLVKITLQGDSIWTKQIVVNQLEILYDMDKTQDGGFIILADTYQDQMVVLKVDQDGEEIWQKNISTQPSGTFPSQLSVANDGGFIITGVHFNGSGLASGFLLKTDANGDQEWIQDSYDPAHGNYAYSAQQDMNGDIYFCGHWSPSPTAWDHQYYLVKTDFLGNKIWDQIIPGASNTGDPDYPSDLIISNDNHVVFTGKTFVPGYGYIMMIAKFDPNGNIVFNNNIYSGEIAGVDIKQSPAGNYFIAGRGNNGGVSHELNVVKIDPDGNVIWSDYYAWEPSNYFSMGQANEIEVIGDDSYMAIGWMHHEEAILVGGTWMCATHLYIVTPEISTGLVRKDPKNDVLVYPNPATDFVNIKSENTIDEITVYNQSGQFVKKIEVGNKSYQLNVSQFMEGLYLIQAKTNAGVNCYRICIK